MKFQRAALAIMIGGSRQQTALISIRKISLERHMCDRRAVAGEDYVAQIWPVRLSKNAAVRSNCRIQAAFSDNARFTLRRCSYKRLLV
jgi:hypothetical protein